MSNELINVESSNVLIKAFENNENGWTVRAIEINGEPWFVGKDVAEVLGYSNTRDALSRHVDNDDKRVSGIATPFGVQNMTLINEPGLYSLAVRSALPNAKKFTKWLTHDVAVSIRKTGSYVIGEKVPQTFLEALELAVEKEKQRLALEQKYIDAENRAQENQEVKDLYDATNANEEYWLPMKTVADVLDVIGVGRNNLYKFLREKHILSQNNEPMRCYQEMGYIRSSYVTGFKNQVICVVSLKGLKFIFKKLQNNDLLPRTTKMEEWLKLCTALDSDNVNVSDVVVNEN